MFGVVYFSLRLLRSPNWLTPIQSATFPILSHLFACWCGWSWECSTDPTEPHWARLSAPSATSNGGRPWLKSNRNLQKHRESWQNRMHYKHSYNLFQSLIRTSYKGACLWSFRFKCNPTEQEKQLSWDLINQLKWWSRRSSASKFRKTRFRDFRFGTTR